MKLYRIKHKKTGLYLEMYPFKRTLSKIGSFYKEPPLFEWFERIEIFTFIKDKDIREVEEILIDKGITGDNQPSSDLVYSDVVYLTTSRTDWETEEVEVSITNIIDNFK